MAELVDRQKRLEMEAQVRITVPDSRALLTHRTVNLSRGGTFIRTETPPPVGKRVRLSIRLRDGAEILEATGTVTWTRSPGEEAPPGMGIEFSDVSETGRALLEELIPVVPDPAISDAIEASLSEIETSDELDPGEEASPFSFPELTGTPSERIIGIDLGTTFSCASYVEDGRTVVIPTDRNARSFSSAVYVAGEHIIAGDVAYQRLETHPLNVVHCWKRVLGRRYFTLAVQDAQQHVTYSIVRTQEGLAAVAIDSQNYGVEQFAALVLYEIRLWTREHLDEVVTAAVITVPAHFSDRQREAVRAAAALAGFVNVRIISEPVAAAVAYGNKRGLSKRVLVYDFGGGTFDVSILQIDGEVFEVLATGGDAHLGGMDFDDRVMGHLLVTFLQTEGIDLTSDTSALARVRAAAERAKRDLSEATETQVTLPFIARRGGEGVTMDITVRRDDLEGSWRALAERTLVACDAALAAAKLTADEIDEILAVGGMTRVPLVRRMVEEHLGKAPRGGVHPDEAISLGAAIFADSLGTADQLVVLDCAAFHVGVVDEEGKLQPVIATGSRLPAEGIHTILADHNGQTAETIDIYQGDSEYASQCEFLGTLEIVGRPVTRAGDVLVAVRFVLNEEGTLNIYAPDPHGVDQMMTLRSNIPRMLPVAAPAQASYLSRGTGFLKRLFR